MISRMKICFSIFVEQKKSVIFKQFQHSWFLQTMINTKMTMETLIEPSIFDFGTFINPVHISHIEVQVNSAKAHFQLL